MIEGFLNPVIARGQGSFREQAIRVANALSQPAKLITEFVSGDENEKQLWRDLKYYELSGDKKRYAETLAKLYERTTVEAVGLGSASVLPGSMLKVNAPRAAEKKIPQMAMVPRENRWLQLDKSGYGKFEDVGKGTIARDAAERAASRVSMEPQAAKQQFNTADEAWVEALKQPDRIPDFNTKTGMWEVGSISKNKGKLAAPAINRGAKPFEPTWPEILGARMELSKVEKTPIRQPGLYDLHEKVSKWVSTRVDPSFSQESRERIAQYIENALPRMSEDTKYHGQLLATSLSRKNMDMAEPQFFRGRSGTLEGKEPPKVWTPDWVHWLKQDPKQILDPTTREIINAGVGSKESAANLASAGFLPVRHFSREPERFARDFKSKPWQVSDDSPFETVGTHTGSPQAAMVRAGMNPISIARNPSGLRRAQARTFPILADMSNPYTLGGFVPSETALKNALNLKSFLATGYQHDPMATRKVLNKQGYTALPYVNDVEDVGSMSVIIPNPLQNAEWPAMLNPNLREVFRD